MLDFMFHAIHEVLRPMGVGDGVCMEMPMLHYQCIRQNKECLRYHYGKGNGIFQR